MLWRPRCGEPYQGRSPLEAIFIQHAVVDMPPINLIITSLDVIRAFPNSPHRLLRAVWKCMGLPFQGFLQAYLATRMYAVETDVGTTEAVWGASPIPAAQPVALFARPDQEFSCRCYGILISVGFL